MKKKIIILIILFISLIGAMYYFRYEYMKKEQNPKNEIIIEKIEDKVKRETSFPMVYSKEDKNNNGIADPIDVVEAIKKDLEKQLEYKDAYYVGGYPPESEGVCTDVIWRGLKAINVDLKSLIDDDIKNNLKDYKRISGNPDPNIDFRRVLNQMVFFEKYCSKEVNEFKKDDIENLKSWQPGDIILFLKPYEHVGIVSDKRDDDGIPFVIHNSTPHMKESKISWFPIKTFYHYRWKY